MLNRTLVHLPWGMITDGVKANLWAAQLERNSLLYFPNSLQSVSISRLYSYFSTWNEIDQDHIVGLMKCGKMVLMWNKLASSYRGMIHAPWWKMMGESGAMRKGQGTGKMSSERGLQKFKLMMVMDDDRHDICPKFYNTGISGQTFYTVRFTKFWKF